VVSGRFPERTSAKIPTFSTGSYPVNCLLDWSFGGLFVCKDTIFRCRRKTKAIVTSLVDGKTLLVIENVVSGFRE
jgi:hypothetical protein